MYHRVPRKAISAYTSKFTTASRGFPESVLKQLGDSAQPWLRRLPMAGSPDERPTGAAGTVGVNKQMSTVSSTAVWDVPSSSSFQSVQLGVCSTTTASD